MQDTIETLNDLIETCRDGEYGFKTCAEHAESPKLKTVFADRASACAAAAAQLQGMYVIWEAVPTIPALRPAACTAAGWR